MKNDKKQKKLYIYIAVAAVILIALIGGMIASQSRDVTQETVPTDTTESTVPETTLSVEPSETEEETTEPTKPADVLELVNGEIQTPYGVLHYPEALADHLLIVQASAQPYTLEFYAVMEGKADLKLFDISFGEDSGGNMGLVNTSSGEVPLNVTIYSLSFDQTWTEGEIITAQAMQDVVNELIDQLDLVSSENEELSPSIETQPENMDTVNYLEIVTPDCAMYYPARWRSSLQLVHDESEDGVYKVHFYGKTASHEPVLLFSIYLGGDEGEQLGAVIGGSGVLVTVNLLLAELDLTDWSAEDADLMYTMQEASNQLVDLLPLLD